MPLRLTLLLAAALFGPLAASGADDLEADAVRVAAAISLKDALNDAAAAYKAEGRGDVRFTFGASGQLQSQIEYGAPIDAFISAAHPHVDALVQGKRAEADRVLVVAGNQLVLVVPPGAKAPPSRFADLANRRHRRVAMGEPKTVPAGQYARQVLRSLNIEETLKGRVVYGANVRQVLSYVERGEVDAGIVYATDARESGDRVRAVATADASTHDPIEYPAVVLSNSGRRAAAEAFLDFLATEKARDIFARKGFTVPNPRRPRE